MKLIKLIFVIVFVLVFIGFCAPQSINWIQTDPVLAINEFLPGSVKLIKEDGADAIEFCPDNTCVLFVSKIEVNVQSLKDFVFLYVYYASDYYVLDKWREQESSAKIANAILSKQEYNICNEKTNEEKARCLLKYLAKGDNISLYAVRYDENYRSKVKIELNEAF